MKKEQINTIISSCIKKDRVAQKQLYNFSYRKLMNVPLRYVKNKEEANWHFNLAMLKVYDSLNNFSMDRDYIPWAKTILVRSTIDQLRQSNKFKSTISVVDPANLEGISGFELNTALQELDYQDILNHLRALPDKQRIIFSLHEIDELTHEEIEELTGVKRNTSKWLLAKAKLSLKNKLVNRKIFESGKA